MHRRAQTGAPKGAKSDFADPIDSAAEVCCGSKAPVWVLAGDFRSSRIFGHVQHRADRRAGPKSDIQHIGETQACAQHRCL